VAQKTPLIPPFSGNKVLLTGRLSRIGRTGYTPSGLALQEIEVAFPQVHLDRKSIGYCTVSLTRTLPELLKDAKIGDWVELEGSLWIRQYKDKNGQKKDQFRRLAEKISFLSGKLKPKENWFYESSER